MKITFDRVEDGMMQYLCTDADDRVYGIGDTIQNGEIVDTLVIDMETYDEVEDSELFKRIITARAIYMSENYDVLETINSI